MGRLCERPGCSENAALAYGMFPENLVFWVDVLREGGPHVASVLCQRHGDSMTVPRGWTLNDLRDPDLHLFRPPPRPDGPASRRNRARRRTGDDDTGQLALDGLVESVEEPDVAVEQTPDVPAAAVEPGEPTPSGALNWKPAFDEGDDLDGLLAARSPLLSRAFRGERG